jgi:hypothetical protein
VPWFAVEVALVKGQNGIQHRHDHGCRMAKNRNVKAGSTNIPWLAIIALLLVFAIGAAFYFYYGEKTDSNGMRALQEEGKLPISMGASWREIDDPSKDGWDTEVFSGKADKVLKQLGELLTTPAKMEASQFESLIDPAFSCGLLLPDKLQTVFKDGVIQVERAKLDDAAKNDGIYSGAKGITEAFGSLASLVKGGKEIHSKFKLFRVAPLTDGTFKTVQYVALSGHLDQGMVEQNATWEMRWTVDEKTHSPHLQGIRVTEFELVRSQKVQGLFSDCTKSVMEGNECYQKQFLVGMNHWYERIQDRRHYYILSTPGLAVGDVNGDGLEDLYVCQDEGLPNRLLIQQPDGSVKDMAKEWGVDWLHSSRGALLVDLDNDGKPDLVVAMVGHIVIAQNMGNKFEVRCILPCDEDTFSLSAADYNNDGKLDLYVSVYNPNAGADSGRGELLGGIPFLGSEDHGGHNALFRNDGNWKFTNVTKEVGLEHQRYSFSSCWEDYDQDGWMDLYVANDYGWSQLFRNDHGKFVDVTRSAGTMDKGFSMSASWADYDQDGLMDVYAGNMFSGAGGRITFQEKYLRDKPELRSLMQQFVRGNTLFKNLGNGQFKDVTEQTGVTMGRWSWSSNFVDVNNDGLEDIVVANGYITTDDTSDL